MNINRYSIINVLKFTLIFSSILGVINSVSASGSGSQTESMNFLTILKDLNLDIPIFTTLIILFISWYFNKNQQRKQLSDFAKNQTKILENLDRLNELDRKLNNLDIINREIIKQAKENNQKLTDLEIKLHESLNKQKSNQFINHQIPYGNLGLDLNNNSNSDLDKSTNEKLDRQFDTDHSSSTVVVDNIPEFVEKYNEDRHSLSDEVIATVAETQESIAQRRSGNSDTVTLENTPQKKYWIVQEGNDYYLIPHAKIKIDEYNIKTLESLFECIDFTPEYSDFWLIQPATVFQLDSELWQIDKKGKLKFS